MNKFVVVFQNDRGCSGHENIFPDLVILDSKCQRSHALAKELQTEGGFYLNSKLIFSWLGPDKWVPFHNILNIYRYQEPKLNA